MGCGHLGPAGCSYRSGKGCGRVGMGVWLLGTNKTPVISLGVWQDIGGVA